MTEAVTLVDVSSDYDREEIVDALQRVLTSNEFRQAPRSRDFLAYVVSETLAGRAERLSERTVGRRALERGPEFDGRTDSTVRVRATRVRTALERYYAGEGADDPVQIVLAPGSYVAEFARRPTGEHRAAPVPGVVVVRMSSTGDERASAVASSLSEALATTLSGYPEIRVVGPTRLRGDAWVAARGLGVSSVLVGRVVVRDGRARMTARLLSTSNGEVIWSDDDEVDASDLAGFDTEHRWARGIAAQLGDAVGAVVRHELHTRADPGSPEFGARLAFYSYVERGTVDSILEATAAADDALASGARTSTLLSIRAALSSSAYVYGIADDPVAELERAASFARESLALDGANAHAHLVLGSVARDRRQWDLGLEHAAAAVRLRPYHPSYLVGAGITVSGCGEWQRGASLILEGHRLHPGQPGHTRAWLALGHLVQGDDARALAEAGLLPSEGGYVWGPLYRAMALVALGHDEQARTEAALVRSMRPDILDDPRSYFDGRMRVTPGQLDRLVGLVAAASG